MAKFLGARTLLKSGRGPRALHARFIRDVADPGAVLCAATVEIYLDRVNLALLRTNPSFV